MKVAALDLGTNTFLCLLATGDQNGIQKVEKDLHEIVRLGQDVQKTGLLHPEALQRAEKCLMFFSEEINKFKPDKVMAVATSAVRDAKNGHLLFEMGQRLRIPIEVIAGDEEARVSFVGATISYGHSVDTTLVIDIGGGSTELIVGNPKSQEIIFSRSIDIGAVRLTEQVVKTQPVSISDQTAVREKLAQIFSSDCQNLRKLNISKAIAVAGTPTSLAALELGGFNQKKIEGHVLTLASLRKWAPVFAETSIQEKEERFQLGKRSDIIYAGTKILIHILEELNLSGVVVSTQGVRYGVAIKLLNS